MLLTEPSIAAIATTLPFPGARDLHDRIASLTARLRNPPLNAEGAPLFAMAADALAALGENPGNVDHVLCLLFVTRYRYYNGDAYAALAPAAMAVRLAERHSDHLLRSKALKMLGVVQSETGEYPGAVSSLTAALAASRAAGDPVQEVEILSNLGLAHQHAGHFGAAVPCYERAVEVARSAKIPPLAPAIALNNIALACLNLRDFARGISAAEDAIEALGSPSDTWERTIRAQAESYYTRLLLEVRNLPLARERAKLARLFATGTNEIAELSAEMVQGLVETHDPISRDIGLSRLQQALNRSRKGASSALRDALATIVRGYEAAGQPNAALIYLHEIVQLNRDSRVRNVLQHHHLHLAKVGRDLDRQAQDALQEQREELRFKRLSMDALRECMQVLEKNTVAAELHDDETGEHCYRVGALAKELAMKKGMDPEMCTLIDLSARLHDIGKLRVPDSILLKPGRFTPEERAIMEKHCEHGWELIGEGGLAQLFVAQEIALNHHERWDGNGYPNRRQGSMIPLAARVTALADVFDALTHRRCYKEAWSVDDALKEIASLRGKHFDPELTDLFLELVPQLQNIHGNLDDYLGVEARKNNFITDRVRVAQELKSDLGTFDVRR
jgi:HD-GYP domain-containing protein (c-di-GMP phosphodiesterase class II)